MKKLDKCHNAVLQSSNGISADEVAKKLGVHRTTVYGYLISLELMGKVYSEHGTWYARTGEQTIKPLEKEIVIELPMPKNQWQQVALLEIMAHDWAETLPRTTNTYRIVLEKLKETRTITIRGKNVDDLDLEKLGNLIQQANRKASKINFRGLLKSLKRSQPDNSQR